jgi:hypothetical protein
VDDSSPKRSRTNPWGTPDSEGGPNRGSSREPNAARHEEEREILHYVNDALPRFALHGVTSIEGGLVRLKSSQGEFKAPLGTLSARWLSLDEASRRERAADIVRQFVRQRNALSQPDSAPSSSSPKFWGALGIATVSLLVLLLLWPARLPSGASNAATGPAQATAHAESAQARSERVCEATKARVARGAPVNVSDTDGWAVEYMALRPPGGPAPLIALGPYLLDPGSAKGSAWIWPDEPSLVGLAGADALVQLEVRPLNKGGENWERLTLTFHGPLVDPYFREEERARFYHVASAVTASLGASHAGLYARCEHEQTHYLGAWFRGPNEGGAATALVFALGAFADPPHIASPFLRPLGEGPDLGYAFGNVETATAKLTRASLSDAMGRNQGMVTGAPKAPVTLTFGFRDGSSGTRASRQLARGAGLLAD